MARNHTAHSQQDSVLVQEERSHPARHIHPMRDCQSAYLVVSLFTGLCEIGSESDAHIRRVYHFQ